MFRVFSSLGLFLVLMACAGEETAQTASSEKGIATENAQPGVNVATDDRTSDTIPMEIVREMSKGYNAPWEPEEDILEETSRLVNWLSRQNIPLSSIRQIINWSQFRLEFSTLTDPCVRTESCTRDGLLSGYYMRMSSAILDSKTDGRETITPAPMAGDGMLVTDAIDLLHNYYLESETWSAAEFKRIDALRAEVDKIERVPGNISQSFGNGILKICQTNTDPVTHEVTGPCTEIRIH
jgi:hypothetical protein